MVLGGSLQYWKIGTQICVFVTSILLVSIPLSCIPMVYLGNNMLNQFSDASYVIAEKTFIKETNIIGSMQQKVLYEYATIGKHQYIQQARNTLYLMNKLLINTNHTVSQSQAMLMSTYLTQYKNQDYAMTTKSLPGAVIDIRTVQAVNQVFWISTLIPLLSFEEGISQQVQLVLRNSVLVVQPAATMPSTYNLSQQIWYLQFMQGFQKLANSSIDTKLAFKSTGLETMQIGLKAFATSVPCFSQQGVLVGSLMYETKASVIKELVQKYRNTEYTQYIVLNTGLLLFTEVNNSNYQYFQNSSITGFDQWDWTDIITNNYKNSTCVSLRSNQLLCKYNSLYKQESYIQATYLPIQQLYIISVITEEYLQTQISKETNFVNEKLNEIIYRYLVELAGVSFIIIIITIIAIRIIFQPLQCILDDVSYSIFSGRLDILRRIRNRGTQLIKDADNCFELLASSYKKHKSEGKSNECILIENREEHHERKHNTFSLMQYSEQQLQYISDDYKKFNILFYRLIVSVQ